MFKKFYSHAALPLYICQMKKVGILGGGQLGRMLIQAGANYPVSIFILENDSNCPAAALSKNFVKGDIKNFDDVYNFGKDLDVVTIEIESVNLEALEKLEAEGKKIYPNTAALKIIKSKIAQKQFYKNNGIPTSDFIITQNKNEAKGQSNFLPAVHKLDMGGYDGKGVQVLKNEKDLDLAFDAPAVLEKMVAIKKEIAVLIAVAADGSTIIYPAVDMVFEQELNLLSHQVSPAKIAEKTLWKIEAIALKLVRDLKSPGIFAVELFIDEQDQVWVNETAPRVHNSGHHTIEANYSSQFDMLWRILLNFPLGNPDTILPAALVNLIGSEHHTGTAHYEGLEKVLAMDNVFIHIYGKEQTKPGRKMGHVTILSTEPQELIHKVNQIKNILSVKTIGTS